MTGSHEEAEDLVQETLLKAYTHIADFELRASLSTWLFRIATNTCLDSQRGKKPWDLDKRWQWFRDNGELVKQMEQNLYLSPERAAEVKEVAATCVNCITMSLPEKQRAAIVLCDQDRPLARRSGEVDRRVRRVAEDGAAPRAQEDDRSLRDALPARRRGQRVRRLHRRRPHPAPRRRRPASQRRKPIARTKVAPPRRDTGGAPVIQRGLTCDQIDELLSDLLADELPHAARAGVEAHLAPARPARRRTRR